MREYVLTCEVSDSVRFEPSYPSQPCASPIWIYHEHVDSGSQVLPPLSVEDGATISMAIALVWVVGFCWREIRRSLNRF